MGKVCIYCQKKVKQTDKKWCCMWLEFFTYTRSENFSSKEFKQKVKSNYKAVNPKNTIKNVVYDLSAYHLHTSGIEIM
jgi:hypothetical protein